MKRFLIWCGVFGVIGYVMGRCFGKIVYGVERAVAGLIGGGRDGMV